MVALGIVISKRIFQRFTRRANRKCSNLPMLPLSQRHIASRSSYLITPLHDTLSRQHNTPLSYFFSISAFLPLLFQFPPLQFAQSHADVST